MALRREGATVRQIAAATGASATTVTRLTARQTGSEARPALPAYPARNAVRHCVNCGAAVTESAAKYCWQCGGDVRDAKEVLARKLADTLKWTSFVPQTARDAFRDTINEARAYLEKQIKDDKRT